jgi:2-polyprenyl-3-methyl-5-hydroxy-6-metoxy-1,4-benzoquinol methylase
MFYTRNMQIPTDENAVHREILRNAIAEGADQEALRFSVFCADRLATRLHPALGDKILDVATGTGALALAASQAVGKSGRVTAIDTADSLLARLDDKIKIIWYRQYRRARYGCNAARFSARLFPAHGVLSQPLLANRPACSLA